MLVCRSVCRSVGLSGICIFVPMCICMLYVGEVMEPTHRVRSISPAYGILILRSEMK